MSDSMSCNKSRNLPMLEPLTLKVGSPESSNVAETPETPGNTLLKCLFCDEHYNSSEAFRDDFLRHMLQQHKFVIGDFKAVPDFRRYVEYWTVRFRGRQKTDFCSVIRTNTGANDVEPSEDYYLLCDNLPEDKDVRKKLQVERLQEVLTQQQKERVDANFNQTCLFCHDKFTTNRSDLFNHMVEAHTFNVGHPDNLVYTDELLETLHDKLEKCICFYCEKIFKDRHVLKEHMRKKQHKLINPKNKRYDKYYIINYLELGKTWEDIHSEDDGDLTSSNRPECDSDWEDWKEESGDSAVCLYCDKSQQEIPLLLDHMKETHGFDMIELKEENKLTFYQQIKLVNYIRRQVHTNSCPMCEQRFDSKDELNNHLTETDHMTVLPDNTLWDQAEYYFPTYENDSLLFALEAGEDNKDGDDGEEGSKDRRETEAVIIAEDIPVEDILSRRDFIMKEFRS